MRKPTETQPARMGPLATLPVFLTLAGRRAVIVGGTAAAAWKAELLAAAGADVAIYAEAIEPEMAALLERGAAAGTLTRHARAWASDIFQGAAVAVAHIDEEAEARAFSDAAAAAGVPVNVIDKPALCGIQLGAIVNRSPVVIGISTDGAAPILGQAVRRRIETLLPPSLAAWGSLARSLRGRVAAKLAYGAPRRAFWERFVDRAFGPPPEPRDAADLEASIDAIVADVAPARGRVTLVGAGPGDAELLTLKAMRALQSADIILYDDLVSAEVLELARREARRMLVGKRRGGASCAQDDINTLMIGLARTGKHVVRLKSGDPTIFGRAGEEIAEIERAGIPVSIVPGITAASAMAASLNVSLTHRDHARSVRFVTGHCRSGDIPDDLDWPGLADPRTTLVFYMAGRTAGTIAERLMAHGMEASTSAVVVTGISRHDQACRYGQLGTLGALASDNPPGQPVLIGIGEVFRRAAEVHTGAENATLQQLRNGGSPRSHLVQR